MNISYSFGLIDLLHFGHINALKKADKNADLSVFGLVGDSAVDAWIGAHVSNEEERKEVVESIKYVDEVWPQRTFDPIDNLRILHTKYPNATITLFHGNEWAIISAKKYVESIGGNVVKLDYYNKLSPQAILDALNKNEIIDRPLNNNLISTKANTLQALKKVLTKAFIEDMFVATVGEIRDDSDTVIDKIKKIFHGQTIVVRSSSKREDAFSESNAGHFASILNIDSSDEASIRQALSKVILSYGENIEDDDQVLIQAYTTDVQVSGVVFTRDIQRNRAYYVINYDVSGSTDSVTSGRGGMTAWLSHSISRNNVPQRWCKLMDAVWELEDILSGTLLDIEFAITKHKVVIFQVRPLAAAYKFGRKNDDKDVECRRNAGVEKYINRCAKGLTCFSDMAFWNPAEIIGDNPKNLDYSLYREIITKRAWNNGLISMGYRTVHGELMYRFGNKPYISVEKSFEALMPSTISDELSKKLRFLYLKKIKEDLSTHDKIEFEISHNCYDLTMHNRLANLMLEGFGTEEILELENALKLLTKKIIINYATTLSDDLRDLKQLEGIRIDIQNITKETEDYRLIAKSIHNLLDAISKFGTPQFSRHARCAFIAKSLCKSLMIEGYISSDDYNTFMSNINTIAVEYDRDYHDVLDGKMTKDEFHHIYGHLRAGTYNIRSPRYDQMNNLFDRLEDSQRIIKKEYVDYDDVICVAFDKALAQEKIDDVSGKEIVSFIKKATEQREYFKFIFSKSLSFAIELIKRIGSIVGIDAQELSYLELPEIYASEYYSDIDRLHEFWMLIIEKRRELFIINSKIILPSVISSEMDFDYIENIDSRPNYITENKITSEVVVLNDETDVSLDGKIIIIEKADPGFDWIFSKGIGGLVTKYGGAASHMAIRCAEFKVPAAIGSGTTLFDYATKSKMLTVDCKHEKITRVE